jgi:NADP-dependent 3-hydroxy acid dehydrogenase YdfG
MNIKDKVFMITGATGGMGEALCNSLAENGAKLVLCSNQSEKMEKQCRELKETYGIEVVGTVLDVTKENEVKDFVEKANEKFGAIHALINLAGLSIPGKIESTDEAVYDTLMDVNVKGVFLMAKHFAAYAGQDAIVINIGSMAARRVNANAPLYCLAKSAVNTLSQGLTLQMAEKNIRVTTLNPGGADTPFWGDRPVKREKFLQTKDIVNVIMFVLQTDARVAIHSIDFESIHMI